MSTVTAACPQCGRADMIVKVTSPQAPRVLPISDAEILQAAQQLNSGPSPVPPPPPRTTRRSGCLVAVLVVVGIFLAFGGAFYGTYHPICPAGSVMTDPIGSLPSVVSTNPRCVKGDVVTPVQEEYVFPGGQLGRPATYGGCGLFLLGILLPIIWWFQGRNEREQQRAYQLEVSRYNTQQRVPPAQLAEARARINAAYYCSRDDGFFFPGHPQFYPRTQWTHFLFD